MLLRYGAYGDLRGATCFYSDSELVHLVESVLSFAVRQAVKGAESGVKGAEFGVEGSEFGAEGAKFGVMGAPFGVWGADWNECKVSYLW